jgi:AAA ATPase domain
MTTEHLSTKSVLAEIERRMRARNAEPQTDPKLSYLLAASVLHVFDAANLKPWLPLEKLGDPLQQIFDYTTPAIGWRHRRFRSLKLEIRRSALAWLWRFGERNAVRDALAVNPERTQTDVQAAFEKWLDDLPFVLERMTFDQLTALTQLYDWGLADFGGLPERRAAVSATARRSAVAVFEHLVDDSFVGRDTELQILRDYVGVVSLSLRGQLRGFVGSESRPPLVIYGPGGVGKTALIGKFLLEHVNSPSFAWFPFAYLPFDSETLDVREPYTILLSAAAQLTNEIDASGSAAGTEAAARFRDLVAKYRDNRAQLRQRASSQRSQRTRLRDLSTIEAELYRSFGALLEAIAGTAAVQQKASRVPVLLVLDTFEEVYYRAREELIGLWRMLEVVQQHFPTLRVVIAGRVQPRPFTVGKRRPINVSLENLKLADSQHLLRSLGIADPEVAQKIARQVGGNPLTLRLAARVAQREGAEDEISGLTTYRFWVFSVADDIVQGQLYRRILDHIHDPAVRALAHPGMVLRRVTQDIIRDVLAPTCGLGHIDDARADALFEELRSEYALVKLDDDRSLRYREDVRRPMLAMLISDKPDKVKELQKAAVSYYMQSTVPKERAEELYHRLMLGESPEVLARRWLSGVEPHLATAVEELPAKQQIWLAGRMSLELPPETVALADLETWESIIGRRALAAFRYSEPLTILDILAERKERSASSPLFAIEARALLAVNDPLAAADILDRALENYPLIGNRGRLAELLWLRAQSAMRLAELLWLRAQSAIQQGKRQDAYQWLVRLKQAASLLRSQLPSVQAYTEMVSLEPEAEISSTKEILAVSLHRLSAAEVDSERALIRLALVRLGASYPATIAELAPAVVGDFILMLKHSLIEIAPIAPILRELPGLDLGSIDGSANLGAEAVRGILRQLASGRDNLEVTRALINLLRLENASLAGASLAGLDAYRESWELSAAREVLL